MTDQKIINGVNVDGLMETVGALRNEPELGRSRFRAKNRWRGGALNQTCIQDFYAAGKEDTTRTEPFLLDADEPPLLLGENRGANPVEHLLNALAACMTTAMVYHAASRGIQIEELESELEGDIDLRGFMGITKDVPKGYQNIRVTFRVKSDAPAEKLKELAQMSPVFDTVTSAVPVSVEVQKKEAGQQSQAA